MFQPRNAERGPRRKDRVPEIALGGGDKNKVTAAAHIPSPRRELGVCWRCGHAFADTTDEVLSRCTELARHPGPIRFEDIPREDW